MIPPKNKAQLEATVQQLQSQLQAARQESRGKNEPQKSGGSLSAPAGAEKAVAEEAASLLSDFMALATQIMSSSIQVGLKEASWFV